MEDHVAAVEAIMSLEVPGEACGGFGVDHDSAASWSQRSGIEVKGTMAGLPCRDDQVGVTWVEEIECELCMWKEEIPACSWECRVCAG